MKWVSSVTSCNRPLAVVTVCQMHISARTKSSPNSDRLGSFSNNSMNYEDNIQMNIL